MVEATTGGDLASVESEGLKRLDAGLVQTITQARSLGDVFHEVALGILGDLAKIAIERTLIPPLSAGGDALAGLGAGLGGLFGFAGGGLIAGAGSGTSDSLLARVSAGEFVMPAAATADNLPLLEAIRSGLPGFAAGGLVGAATPFAARSAGAPANAGRGGVSFDLRGAVMTQDLLDQMNEIGARAQTTAIAASVGHTESRLAATRRANARAQRSDLTRY